MESIAIIIPVYERPKRVADILSRLLADDYPRASIVVVVDGRSSETIDAALAPFEGRIEVLRNEERLGKSASLMRAASGRSEDLLLFFDNDVILGEEPAFLQKFANAMRSADIANFPFEIIGDTLLARMMRYEFLGTALSQIILGGLARRSPAVMGAALGIRRLLFEELGGFRRLVCEDIDLGARAFERKARFVFVSELLVRTEVPETVPEWMRQRKRWAVGNIVWLNEHFLMILKHAFGSFRFFVSALALFLPSLALSALFFGLRKVQLGHFLPLVYLVIDRFNFLAGFFFWVSHYHAFVFDGLVPVATGLAVSEVIYLALSRRLGFDFNPLEFVLFYFVYSPIWVLANVVAWFLVLFRVDLGFDWKT